MMDPATLLPGAREAIQGLIKATYKGGVPRSTMALVHLRASQINACAADVDSGNRAARKAGETEERLWSLAAWREAPYYTDAERAALALTEVMTRLADRERPDAVPDDVWDEITKHYTEEGRAALILRIATTNMFNRINTAIRATAGSTNWG
jgi:AhpD family alkylhydroperoxidase